MAIKPKFIWPTTDYVDPGPTDPEVPFGPEYPGVGTPLLRAPNTPETLSIHSGHSLVDAYVHYGAWPGSFRSIIESMVPGANGMETVMKATIPGSSLRWRWDNPIADGRPNDPSMDPKVNVGEVHTLVITESGPPPRVGYPAMAETMDHFLRFAANQIENGLSSDIVIWTIWPALGGPGTSDEFPVAPFPEWREFDFRTGQDEYYRSFRYIADYGTWKLKQLYPDLPADWRIWTISGDRWMARVYDDIQAGLVPGITDIADIFDDNIHTNDIGGYGLGCYVATCLYQFNMVDAPNAHVPEYISPALAAYYHQIAWELANRYEWSGLGGEIFGTPAWTEAMGDYLPDWTFEDPNDEPEDPEEPEEPTGAMPETVLSLSPQGVVGPTPTGTLPAMGGESLVFGIANSLDFDMALTDRYFALRFQLIEPRLNEVVRNIIGFRSPTTQSWSPGEVVFNLNLWTNPIFLMAAGGGVEQVDVPNGQSVSIGSWHTVEMWTDGTTIQFANEGVSGIPSIMAAEVVSTYMRLNTSADAHDMPFNLAGLVVCDHLPTPEERAAVRAWLAAAGDV